MQKNILFMLACIIVVHTKAQPYVDLLNTRYTSSLFNNKMATTFTHLYVGSDLPVKLKNNKLIVFSPFYDQWNVDSAYNEHYQPVVSSIAVPVSVILPLYKDRWLLTATAIPRLNSEGFSMQNSFQMGGVLLATYKKFASLKYKAGVYANSEFFGLFVIPLAGIDWRINDKNNLFGVLPGRLTYEHKLSTAFYTGATFRAITNSYRLNNGSYLRIDDNQISSYLDWYATQQIVFSGEMGYGVFRKLRTGLAHEEYNTAYKWGNGAFFRLCVAYRIRLKS